MANTMKAVVLTGHGDMDKLEYRTDYPKPTAAAGEVLIKVHACGLNNTDVNTRTGWYSKTVTGATDSKAGEDAQSQDATWGGAPLTFPRIQGGDVVGVVEAVGDGGDAQLIGQRVLVDPCIRCADNPDDVEAYQYLGSELDGGFAEYTTVPVRQVHPINCQLSDNELATFAIAYLTAENMINRAQVTATDTVLVTGASGGVGSALIQLAKRRGATVVAMSGNDNADLLKSLGAEAVIARTDTAQYLATMLQKAIGRATVSVVADVVGGKNFVALLDVIARGGRYVTSGAIAGPIVDLDLRTLYLRDLTLHGATYSPIGTFADLVRYIEKGEIRPLLAASYPLSQFHLAQQQFIQKKHIGNIVVNALE